MIKKIKANHPKPNINLVCNVAHRKKQHISRHILHTGLVAWHCGRHPSPIEIVSFTSDPTSGPLVCKACQTHLHFTLNPRTRSEIIHKRKIVRKIRNRKLKTQ